MLCITRQIVSAGIWASQWAFWSEDALHHSPECICRNSGVRARCASRQRVVLICSVYSGVRMQYASLARVYLQEFWSEGALRQSPECDFDLQCVFWCEDAICHTCQSVSAGVLECGRAAPLAFRFVFVANGCAWSEDASHQPPGVNASQHSDHCVKCICLE